MRIRTAIFAVYVAATAVGCGAWGFFVLSEVRPRHVAAQERTLGDAARVIAAAVAMRPPGAPVDDLAAAAPPGLRIQILDAEGRIAADSHAPAGESASNAAGKRVDERVLDVGGKPGSVTPVWARAPVMRDGRRDGEVVLARPLGSLNAWIWSERKRLAAVGVGVATLMAAAGWWIAARLSRSLERLTAHVEAARTGRRAPLPATRAREVAALGRAFEELRETLEGRHEQERAVQALAHAVKAPLAAIRGAAELLAENPPEDDRRRFLANIRTEGDRIQRIVERLLQVHAVAARTAPTAAETIAVREWLEEAAADLRGGFAARGVAVRIEKVPDAAAVRGERFLLRQAVVHLLQNALDFAPRGGTVTVRTELPAGRVAIAVEDDGPGIPDWALPRVFERFYSLPRPDSGSRSTGLGLALVREIAVLHGGEATVVNRSEGGVRAVFALPRA